jgi:hypothetical protein
MPCERRSHRTPEDAQAEADRLYAWKQRRGMGSPSHQIAVYKCPYCRGWHVGYIYVGTKGEQHHVTTAEL